MPQLQLIADRGRAEITRGAAGFRRQQDRTGIRRIEPDQRSRGILDVAHHFPRVAVEPLVGRDAVDIGVDATEDRGMAGRGDRRGVPVMTILEVRAAREQALEPAFAEVGLKAHEIIGAKLVDRDDDRQARRGGLGRKTPQCQQPDDEQKAKLHPPRITGSNHGPR